MTKEDWLKKLTEEKAFTHKGSLNPNWLRKHSAEEYPELLGDSLPEKIYILLHGRKLCPICGKPAAFFNSSKGYYATCGNPECKSAQAASTFRATCLERYGVENPNQTSEVREKTERTCLERYGTKRASQSEKVKEKQKQTCLERYGKEYITQTESFKEKARQTNLKKFGVEHASQAEAIKEKKKNTFQTRYGVDNPNQLEEVKEKKRKTCLEKYGVEYVSQAPAFKEASLASTKKTCLERYGVDSTFKLPANREKQRETMLKRYGVTAPLRVPEFHHKALSKRGMTKPEKKLCEFLTSRNIPFEYNYDCNGKCFDFAIFKDDQLCTLVEIDGEYFHGLTSDYDLKNVCGISDCERFEKVPEGVKLVVCDSMKVNESFSQILSTLDISYEDWINEVINSLPDEFPYPCYSEARLRNDYKHLCEYTDIKEGARLADSTIRYFHKSIYSAHVLDRPSPVEAWNDKDLLRKCVENRFIYSNSLSSQAIANGFNVCKLAPKVSVFSASRAKLLIQEYLGDCDEIFDPFSGFSGRMLGACSLGKHYIGQDLNEEHVRESNEIIRFHNLNASVVVKDIFQSKGSYECLFTCSPYGTKEHWNNPTEIDKSCDEWIDECLSRFDCKKYLFVVDSTEKYKDNVVKTLSNRSHLAEAKELCILIERR